MSHLFSAYGLCFQSDVFLSDLPQGQGTPDVTVAFRPITPDEMGGPRGGDRIVATIFEDIRFIVEDGCRIVVDVLHELSDGVLRGYLLGPVLSILLRQRGYLVLHACGIAKNGRAIGFVGESGWGKSTLAEYYVQQGYDLVTDDLMAIQIDTEAPAQVIPGYPEIRLRPDAGTHLREDFEDLAPIAEESRKRKRLLKPLPVAPIPLAGLYLLEPRYHRHRSAVLPLAAQRIMIELIQHTREPQIFTDADYTAQHLQQCAALVRFVRIARLQRIRSLDALPDLYRLIDDDLSQPSSGIVAA